MFSSLRKYQWLFELENWKLNENSCSCSTLSELLQQTASVKTGNKSKNLKWMVTKFWYRMNNFSLIPSKIQNYRTNFFYLVICCCHDFYFSSAYREYMFFMLNDAINKDMSNRRPLCLSHSLFFICNNNNNDNIYKNWNDDS